MKTNVLGLRREISDKAATYLHDHPDAAKEDTSFIEARALAQSKALSRARGELNRTVQKRVEAETPREAADQTLFQSLSGLLSELDRLLKDVSEDWHWFDFVPAPGAGRPGKPAGAHLQEGPISGAAGWPHPPRSEKVRLFVQVAGRYAVFIAHDWTCENNGLPAKATEGVKLVAANAAGENPDGEVVEMTLNSPTPTHAYA